MPNKSPPAYSHDPALFLAPILQAKKRKRYNIRIKVNKNNYVGKHFTNDSRKLAIAVAGQSKICMRTAKSN
jgi:hypothetical protein